MRNKRLVILIAILVILSSLFLAACQKEEEIDHTEGFTFSLRGNEYAVESYNGKSDITIPSVYNNRPVTSIAKNAFEYSNLSKVVISEGIKTISENAFRECFGLIEIKIPKSVTTIASDAFYSCSSLYEIIVDADNPNYKSVGGHLYTKDGKTLVAYSMGRPDEEYNVPDGVEKISSHTFFSSLYLFTVNLPSSVKEIDENAFSSSAIKDINVDESNTVFSSDDGILYADNGTKLFCYPSGKEVSEDVHLRSDIKRIHKFALADNQIKRLFLNEGLEEIEERAFVRSSLEEIFISSSVKKIGAAPFEDCSSLYNIEVASNNQHYQDINGDLYNKMGTVFVSYALAKEGSRFTLPRGIIEIAESAFCEAIYLRELEIPNTVTKIGEFALNSPYLTRIILNSSVPPIVYPETFFERITGYSIFVPTSSVDLYRDYNEIWEYKQECIRGMDEL